ncbi:hypothetical protein PAMA_008891 [Pampus argenteus]
MDKNARKVQNRDTNPCMEESFDSQKCLDAYNYNKRMCSAYFQRYKKCMKYWVSVFLFVFYFYQRKQTVEPDSRKVQQSVKTECVIFVHRRAGYMV